MHVPRVYVHTVCTRKVYIFVLIILRNSSASRWTPQKGIQILYRPSQAGVAGRVYSRVEHLALMKIHGTVRSGDVLHFL